MTTKRLVILGSTGSIGRSTLEVVDLHPGAFDISALAAFSNFELLYQQYLKYRPEYLGIVDEEAARTLKEMLKNEPVRIIVGENELPDLAAISEADIVLNAVVGSAGLRASLKAVQSGKRLALANKESLVAGGQLFPDLCEKTGAKILPVDSEHSAIWQALQSGKENEVRRLILTSSGGPFRGFNSEQLKKVTVEQALKHPTWKMGAKITIDSATLANKGLEVIEAAFLFSISVDKIKVIVHPQSIIHSMVEFCDSSVMAQISQPDMRLPISYALFWPERKESAFGKVNWEELRQLTFEEPDMDRFPALELAYDAARKGMTAPAVYNASNEVAVKAFLSKEIGFCDIAKVIEYTLVNMKLTDCKSLDDILAADSEARNVAQHAMETV